MKATLDDLTPEQAARLVKFKEQHGRFWKSDLNLMWWNGTDANEIDGHYLRQIRNQKGPRWLDSLVI